jgi:hypothetical protein
VTVFTSAQLISFGVFKLQTLIEGGEHNAARPVIALANDGLLRSTAHLMADRRVQHPTLNDRSATHVFAAAIGTTAYLRFSASGRMQNVRQLCGSLSALGH